MVRAAWLLAMLPAFAHAMKDLPDETATHTLQCLQRSAEPLRLTAEQLSKERGLTPTYLRVKLLFQQPDQPPVVEVLANTARQEVHKAVLQYLSHYRLPCLQGQPLTATQEFLFHPLSDPEGKPLRVSDLSEDTQRACLVMPTSSPDVSMTGQRRSGVVKVIAEARFTGDGESPPTVTLLQSNRGGSERQAVLNYLSEYRMPCRKAGDRPFSFRQIFTYAYDNAQVAKFAEPIVPLTRFLGAMRGIQTQRVFFDFKTMDCPFRVEWEHMQPLRSNMARSIGSRNQQRAEFLAWLSSLELDLSDKKIRALTGASQIVEVPCGELNLKPASVG